MVSYEQLLNVIEEVTKWKAPLLIEGVDIVDHLKEGSHDIKNITVTNRSPYSFSSENYCVLDEEGSFDKTKSAEILIRDIKVAGLKSGMTLKGSFRSRRNFIEIRCTHGGSTHYECKTFVGQELQQTDSLVQQVKRRKQRKKSSIAPKRRTKSCISAEKPCPYKFYIHLKHQNI